MGKEEIARYEQFLLFPQCFQKLSVVAALKLVSMKKRVKRILKINNSWPELFNFQNSFNCH